MNHVRSLLTFVALVGPFAGFASAQQPAPKPDFDVERAYWDTLDAQGRLIGGTFDVFAPRHGTVTGVIPAGVQTLTQSLVTPNPANRVELVFVGDGYQSAQLGAYAANVNNITASFFTKQPYQRYQPYFSVHRVDVVSVDSGVDNDPTQGVMKNTALDMGYWCGGTDRALCVDIFKAFQYANNVPSVDLVCAIANSSTYGGVGYPSQGLCTSAGANGAAVEIVQHEFGHALGKLADEYDYGGPTTYTGGEPSEPDISKLTSAQMASAGTKWAQWLGTNDAAFDGLVSTYQGAGYSQLGLYRPSNNSLMRSLGRPFNLPSAEAVVIQIYKIVRPIDDSSSTSTVYNGTETLFVTPVTPVGAPLTIEWSLNGQPIPGANGTTLDLTTLGLGACPATVSVKVTDTTSYVINAAARAQWLTQTKSFNVHPGGSPWSNYCVGAPNSVGAGARITAYGSSSVTANNLQLYTTGCRPSTSGIYFYGQMQTQVPFGNGSRCVDNPFFRLPARQANIFGEIVFSLNLNTLSPSGAISPGETWNFQCYYRDVAGGGAGFNASDGLQVFFCP